MEIITSGAYCSFFRVFKVNGIDADVEDFGKSYDDCPGSAPEYGCGYRRFHRYEEPREEVLEKYGITCEEWDKVCDKLDVELHWGRCAECA